MATRTVNPALAAKLEAERRLKEGISGHRTGLPKKLLDLFQPLDPPAKLTDLKKPKLKTPYMGIAQYVGEFTEPTDPDYEPNPSDGRPRLFGNPELQIQARVVEDSIYERRIKATQDKKKQAEEQIEENLKDWDPKKDPNTTADPFKTLFIARVSFEATERKLKREFEEYGPIKSIRLVHEKNNGKSRGYAFIEYEHKNDMKTAYKMADGKKIEGKRVIVDVERGRTVPNWRSRRFGGGKGGESRETKVSKKKPQQAKLLEAAAALTAPAAPATTERAEDGGKEKEQESEKERARDRDRERDRERDRPRERERERDRDRDRAKDQDLSRVPPPDQTPVKSDRDRDLNGRGDGGRDSERRDRDRDRDRDRKRDRSDRDTGERDRRDDSHRSSKRHRDDRERERPRRRERDML